MKKVWTLYALVCGMQKVKEMNTKWSKTNYVQILMNEILDSNCDCSYV